MPETHRNGAVLFDIDGTLVDSNYLHVIAWMRAFGDLGQAVDAARVHHDIGMGAPQLLSDLLGDRAADLGDAARERHKVHYAELHPMLRRFAGARELVRAVGARAKVVMATSASPEELEALRATLEVDDIVDGFTSAQDVDAAKPEPDLVEVALQRAGVAARRAVFVGDTVWDVFAAQRAGVACVCVLTGGIAEAQLREAGAVAVYDDARSLLAELDRSPLASVLG